MRIVDNHSVPDMRPDGWSAEKKQLLVASMMAAATAAAGWLGSHFGLASQSDLKAAIDKSQTDIIAEVQKRTSAVGERISKLESSQLNTVELTTFRAMLTDYDNRGHRVRRKPKPPDDAIGGGTRER